MPQGRWSSLPAPTLALLESRHAAQTNRTFMWSTQMYTGYIFVTLTHRLASLCSAEFSSSTFTWLALKLARNVAHLMPCPLRSTLQLDLRTPLPVCPRRIAPPARNRPRTDPRAKVARIIRILRTRASPARLLLDRQHRLFLMCWRTTRNGLCL